MQFNFSLPLLTSRLIILAFVFIISGCAREPTKSDLLLELQNLRSSGFYNHLEKYASAYKIPPQFLFAIASRETECINKLGDYNNGVGILQIDVQHEIAKKSRDNETWESNPEPLIEFGTKILADNIEQAKRKFPKYTADVHLKIAASGYNHGIFGALKDVDKGDSDLNTTAKNYGRDVMTRMAIFDELLQEGH